METLQTITGIVLILVGLFGAYSAWNIFNHRAYSRSAEKLAPVVLNVGAVVVGIVMLFRWFDFWPLIVGAILLALGYLMRSPIENRTR